MSVRSCDKSCRGYEKQESGWGGRFESLREIGASGSETENAGAGLAFLKRLQRQKFCTMEALGCRRDFFFFLRSQAPEKSGSHPTDNALSQLPRQPAATITGLASGDDAGHCSFAAGVLHRVGRGSNRLSTAFAPSRQGCGGSCPRRACRLSLYASSRPTAWWGERERL